MALTLYRLCYHEQAVADVEENTLVRVTTDNPGPPTGDQVLYELHPIPTIVEETDQEGVYQVRWKDALDWPHQITAL